MTKISFAVSAVVVFIFICCYGTDSKVASSSSTKAQKNMEVDDAISKAFKTNNASMLDSLIAPDFVDHSDMGDRKGIDSLKSMLNMLHTQFKDMKMDRKRQWADDDYVADWIRYTGTNATAMMGMPAGPYDMNGMEITKYSDGKAVEHWFMYDAQTVGQWMMNMGNGSNKMKGDSTKTKSK